MDVYRASDGVDTIYDSLHVVLEGLASAAGRVEVIRVAASHIELPADRTRKQTMSGRHFWHNLSHLAAEL